MYMYLYIIVWIGGIFYLMGKTLTIAGTRIQWHDASTCVS